jgi:hypothetical protein
MKKIFKLLILSFAVSTPSIASAAQWQSLAKMEGSEFFYDQASLSGPKTSRLLSVKVNRWEGNYDPFSLDLKYKVNCTTNEFTLISAKFYTELNLQGSEQPYDSKLFNKVQKASPNTLGADYVNAACGNNSSSAKTLSKPKELASPNTSVPRSSNSPADQSQNTELANRLAKCAGSYKFAAIVAGPNDPNSATLTGTSNISMNVANILTKISPAQLKQIRDNEVAILTSEFEKVANTKDKQRILAWSNSIGARNNACTAFITPLASKIQQDINNSK